MPLSSKEPKPERRQQMLSDRERDAKDITEILDNHRLSNRYMVDLIMWIRDEAIEAERERAARVADNANKHMVGCCPHTADYISTEIRKEATDE